jgi:hypothetical protein
MGGGESELFDVNSRNEEDLESAGLHREAYV